MSYFCSFLLIAVNMLSKKDLAKLRKHIKEDKVLRTQTFLRTNKLSVETVLDNDGGTLLHLVCKMAAENVFWVIRKGAQPSSYLVKDKHGRTPCHYAAINLIKSSKMTGMYVLYFHSKFLADRYTFTSSKKHCI